MVNEAARCLAGEVLGSPARRRHRRHLRPRLPALPRRPFRYADTLGASGVVRRLERYRARHGARFDPAPNLVQMARTGERFY
ncbi:MAG: hypothetical protein M0C28_07840 [Candidatus Moduliflexus flocculans]|nr:hypothetical protein [Candidatus Moduliflexus flocculans]